MISYGRQQISDEDVEAVVSVLKSDFLTQGEAVPNFENSIAEYVGAANAVATNSATSALHLACLALGLSAGDLVWTVPNTFVASANCARYCGAAVDFVDIAPLTCNMSIQALTLKLEAAKLQGTLPKVLITVDFAGQPVEQEKAWKLSREYGFQILEDASHALGSSRLGHKTGSCTWADITVFSFHPVKMITSGEGGMALTNDNALADLMRKLRNHGIAREEKDLSVSNPPPWYYEQQQLGFNYRLSDIHAALGNSQLKRLDSFVEQRNELAQVYHETLSELPLQLPHILEENVSSYHLYVLLLDDAYKAKQRSIVEYLRKRGIGAMLHYMPVHLQPYYRDLGFKDGYCPVAENYAQRAITLPLFPGLDAENQRFVVQTLEQAIEVCG